MKNSIKKILAILLTGIIVVSLASCSVTDKIQDYFKEETTVTEPYTNKSVKPANQSEIIKYFNTISADLKKSNPYNITMGRDFSANDIECENEYVKAAFPTVSKFLINNSSFISKGKNGKEELEAGNINSIADIYPIEGSAESSNVLLKQVSLATCSQTSDHFIITINLKDDATPLEAEGLGEVFNINNKEAILEELKGASDLITVTDYTVEYNGGKIVCTVDRGTDRIVSATYSRVIKVTAEITGQGDFADIKNETVTFNVTENENYTIEWDAPVEVTVAEK